MSERKPSSARKGALSTGSATMSATTKAGTPSSTIITRLRVPSIITVAMPTETWNSDSRSSWPSGRSGEAASAKGRARMLSSLQELRSGVEAFHGRSSMACEM